MVIGPHPTAPLAPATPRVRPHVAVLAEAKEEAERLAGWLARLQGYGDQAPPHVVLAVRVDYTDRLRATAEHVAAVGDEARTRGGEARQRARDAGDRCLELRLRYLVGEIDPAALERGLAEQEAMIAAASAEESESYEAAYAAESLLSELRMHLPDEAVATAPTMPVVDTARAAHEETDDALAFLDSLPASARPVAASDPAPRRSAPDFHSDAGPDTRLAVTSRSLLTCQRCGNGNDPSLWYCDGCGAELS